ncbi:MAG: helix-turn-helix domain-containing protein [Candidatus Acidiferrum sp.]
MFEERITETQKNQLIAWTRKRVSQTEIATRLTCSVETIRKWQKILCPDFQYRPPVSDSQRAQILELRKQGLSSAPIAARTGINARAVQKILREEGLAIKARRPLSPETRAAVDQAIRNREDFLCRIAKRYGVSIATVRRRKIKILGKARLKSTWPPLQSVYSQQDASEYLPTPQEVFLALVRQCVDEAAEKFMLQGRNRDEVLAAQIHLKRDPTPVLDAFDASLRQALSTMWLARATCNEQVH